MIFEVEVSKRASCRSHKNEAVLVCEYNERLARRDFDVIVQSLALSMRCLLSLSLSLSLSLPLSRSRSRSWK